MARAAPGICDVQAFFEVASAVEHLCGRSRGRAQGRRWPNSLADALVKAYQTSPLLESTRAALRGVDETLPQARAARRPQVDASASATTQTTAEAIEDQLNRYAGGAERHAPHLRQRCDQGGGRVGAQPDRRRPGGPEGRGATRALQRGAGLCGRAPRPGVRAAGHQRRRSAGRDAGRDPQPLRGRRGDAHRREPERVAARGVALDLAGAEGQLEVSRQAYLAAVGVLPDNLERLPPLPQVPRSLEDATAIGVQRNPRIISAQFSERAAVYDFDRALAAKGPR